MTKRHAHRQFSSNQFDNSMKPQKNGQSRKNPSSSFFILVFAAIIFQCWLMTEGQYPTLGKCLTYPVQANFNVDKYMGRWYMIEQYANLDSASVCLSADYESDPEIVNTFGNGSFLITTTQLTPLGWTIDEDVVIRKNQSEPAKYIFASPRLPDINDFFPYWILLTDYANYSLIWSCRRVAAFNLQIVRFLSRTHKADRYARDKVYSRMRKLGLNTRVMTKSPQKFCPS